MADMFSVTVVTTENHNMFSDHFNLIAARTTKIMEQNCRKPHVLKTQIFSAVTLCVWVKTA